MNFRGESSMCAEMGEATRLKRSFCDDCYQFRSAYFMDEGVHLVELFLVFVCVVQTILMECPK